jgi:hypothetical protein
MIRLIELGPYLAWAGKISVTLSTAAPSCGLAYDVALVFSGLQGVPNHQLDLSRHAAPIEVRFCL